MGTYWCCKQAGCVLTTPAVVTCTLINHLAVISISLVTGITGARQTIRGSFSAGGKHVTATIVCLAVH